MEKKKKTWKRELIEGSLWILLIGGLYFSGYHVEALGIFQRIMLKTGIFNADTGEKSIEKASYDLKLQDLEGQVHSLKEFEGKTILINIWATWCPPCIAEMPELQKLYRSIDHEKVVFVMISMDKDIEKLQRFIKRKKYDFPVYRLASPLPLSYESNAIPTTFVISPKGEIVFKREGIANYNTDSFKEFLSELDPN